MANLCSNSVVFTGAPSDLENVKALFKEIEAKQEKDRQWYLPPYVTADFSKMQHITVEGEKINYDTRWFPNLAGLIQIADHHHLDFVSRYDELANGVFGEDRYTKGEFYDYRLDASDLEHVDAYNIAALEQALERKIQQEQNPQQNYFGR
ncbi:MAG: hypothetical protein V4577_24250 [Bacteroidota bacterium]